MIRSEADERLSRFRSCREGFRLRRRRCGAPVKQKQRKEASSRSREGEMKQEDTRETMSYFTRRRDVVVVVHLRRHRINKREQTLPPLCRRLDSRVSCRIASAWWLPW